MMSLCERFHCLPSDLEGEDLLYLFKIVSDFELYKAATEMRAGKKVSGEINREIGELLAYELELKKRSKQNG